MTWVHRQQPRHECALPTIGDIPAIGAVGNIGDLWRCDDCGRLWRVTDANQGARGRVIHGKTWRPATLWQRLRYAGTGTARTPLSRPGVPREPQPLPDDPTPQIPGPKQYKRWSGSIESIPTKAEIQRNLERLYGPRDHEPGPYLKEQP